MSAFELILGPAPADAAGFSRRASRLLVLFLALFLCADLALSIWYASAGLRLGRFWDENVNVDNVRALLEAGRFAPANGFYPTLAYAPQALVLSLLERAGDLVGLDGFRVFKKGFFSPGAFLVARSLCALFGAGSLVMTFLLGRRLFSTSVGVMGMLLLAATPWHVHSSANWKPDSLITFMLLLVLYLSIRVLSEPSLGRYLQTGAAIGLAMSSKFTAAAAPLTLMAATGLVVARSRRAILYLVSAGSISLGLFVFLNPQIALFIRDFGWTVRDYGWHASSQGMGRSRVLLGALAFPFDRWAHGVPVATLSFVGGLLLLFLLVFRRADIPRERWGGWILLLTFPLFFVAVYSMGTPRLKLNNYMPLLPVSSLLAAVPLGLLWGGLRGRLPASLRSGVAGALLVVLVLVLAPAPFLYAYRSLVPTTRDVAEVFLKRHLKGAGGDRAARLIFVERWEQPEPQWEDRGRPRKELQAVAGVERLGMVGEKRLEMADGEVFLASRLEAAGEGFYRGRLAERDPDLVRWLRAQPFTMHGPVAVAIARPWKWAGEQLLEVFPSPREGDGAIAELPNDLEPREVVSLVVIRLEKPSARVEQKAQEIEVGGKKVALHSASRSGGRGRYVSERFVVRAPGAAIRYPRAGRGRHGIERIVLQRWLRPNSR